MTQHDERLESALARCLEASESASPESVDQIMAEYPDLEGQLLGSLQRLSRLGLCDPIPEIKERGLPDRLGRYEIEEPLGGGGMGLVFRARDSGSGREVAIKLIRPEQACLPRARARFRREAEAISRLDHPGIVPLLDQGEDQGVGYIAMELIRGCTLAEALEKLNGKDPCDLSAEDLGKAVRLCTARKWPDQDPPQREEIYEGSWIDACVAVTYRACEALQHVHQNGLVHRDVKPSNLLLTPKGQVLLFDFGLTHIDDLSRLTRTGSPLGSPAYMAPELIEGRGADERSDVYGLAVTLYEMLTLRLPFEAASMAALESRILDASCRPPRHWNAQIPRDLQVICLHAMQVLPAHRYPDMASWLQDLDLFRQSEPIRARPSGTFLRMRRWGKRRPALALTLLTLAVFIVGTPTSLWLLQKKANVQLAGARDRAEQNLEMALAAVEDLLEVWGGAEIQDKPALQGTGRKLVERAMSLYSDYLDSTEGEPQVALARGRAGIVLGSLLLREGDLGRAEASVRAAAVDLAMGEESTRMRELRIRSDLLLARILRSRRQLAEARELLTKCLTAIEQQPSSEVSSRLSAELWAERGALHLDLGEASDAELDYGKALVLLEALDTPSLAELCQLGENMIRWGQAAAYRQRRDVARKRYQEAVTFYVDLNNRHPQSFLIRVDYSRALMLLASLDSRMGETHVAVSRYKRAEGLLRGLVRDQPAYPDLRIMLADLLSRMAALAVDDASEQVEEGAFAEAEALFEKLWIESPNLPVLASTWLSHLGRRSAILLREGKNEEAMQVLSLAVDLPEPDLEHANLMDIDKLCRVLRSVATLARRRKLWDQAEKSLNRIVVLRRWILDREPEELGFKMGLAFAFNNQANLYRETGRKEMAREKLRQAIALKQEVLEATPGSPLRNHSLGLSLHNLAGLLIEADKKSEAALLLGEAVASQERALGLQDLKRYRIWLGNSLEALALLKCDMGDTSQLRTAASRIAELLPKRTSTSYRVALLLCRYLGATVGELDEESRRGIEKEIVVQLVRSIESKRLTMKVLLEDSRFGPIRKSKAFHEQFGR